MAASEVHQRVLIANISRGMVGIPLVGATIAALGGGQANRAIFVESGPYLDAGRNRAIEHGLLQTDPDAHNELAWDWLLFIDSDMQFQAEDITTLLAPYDPVLRDLAIDPTSYPVVGGYYVNPYDDGLYAEEGNIGPVVYAWDQSLPVQVDPDNEPLMGAFQRISTTAIEAAGSNFPMFPQLIHVHMIGTGFLAIHHTLIREMLGHFGQPTPWFDEPIVNGRLYGEDMGFAIRMMELGYPVLLNRACRVSHNKTITLTPPIPA